MFGITTKKKKEQMEKERMAAELAAIQAEEAAKQEREAEKRAAFEKDIKERTIYNQTIKNLKNAMSKYEAQKEEFLKIARDAYNRGLMPQYNMAKNGLKIVLDSHDKVTAMYLDLTISNQIKQVTKDTKMFVDTMSIVSRQLSEINSSIDYTQVRYDYEQAISQISQAEEKLRDFSDVVYDSIENYSLGNQDMDTKVSEALDQLIRGSTESEMRTPTVRKANEEENQKIDARIGELEAMIHGK